MMPASMRLLVQVHSVPSRRKGGFWERGVKTRRKRRAGHVTRDELRLGCGKIRFVLGLGKRKAISGKKMCKNKNSNKESKNTISHFKPF